DGSTSSGSAPMTMPWAATAWMTARTRLTPRAKRLIASAAISRTSTKSVTALAPQQEDDAEARQQARRHQQLRHVDQPQPRHDRLHDADGDGDGQHAEHENSPVGVGAAGGEGQHDADDEGAEEEQLEGGGVEDHAERRPAVVEDHDLVDHGQLQV